MAARLLDQRPVYYTDDGLPAAGGTAYFYINGTTTPKDVYGDKALTVNLGATVDLDASGRLEDDVWLDGTYSVDVKDADGNSIWGGTLDDVEAPSELPSQTGNTGYALKTDGEDPYWALLRELPDYTGADDNDVVKIVGGVPVFGAAPAVTDYDGAELSDVVLVNARTSSQAVTATATLALDYLEGAVVELAQDTNVSTLTFLNFGNSGEWASMRIIRTKDNTATPRTIAWGAVKWAGGTAPTLSSTANAIDIIDLVSNGTAVYGFSRGAAFA
jgi:hypothetical protein